MKLILILLSYLGYPAPRAAAYTDLEKYLEKRSPAIKLRNVLNMDKNAGIVQRGMWFKYQGKKFYIVRTNGATEVVNGLGMQEFLNLNEATKHNPKWFDILKLFTDDIDPDIIYLRCKNNSLKSILEVDGYKYLLMEWI